MKGLPVLCFNAEAGLRTGFTRAVASVVNSVVIDQWDISINAIANKNGIQRSY